jgi:hypothetical protein
MKNLNNTLQDFDGNEIPVTIKQASVKLVKNAVFKKPEDKLVLAKLAKKINNCDKDSIKLTVEENNIVYNAALQIMNVEELDSFLELSSIKLEIK